jgi:hypothetical protein
MGGSDHPSNLIELTVEEHAEEHKILYWLYGKWEDKLAWQSLSNMLGKEEIIKNLLSQAGKIGGSKNKGKKNFLGKKHKPETIQKMSVPKTKAHIEAMKGKRPHVNQSGSKNNNAVSVVTPYGNFDTVSESAKFIAKKENITFKRALGRVSYWLNTRDDWKRII